MIVICCETRRLLTDVKTTLKFLTDSHQLDSRPEVRTCCLWNTESPASTIDIATIFPDWLESLLEEIDGLPHLDQLHRGIIIIPPEILNTFDLGAKLLQSCFIQSVSGFLLGTRSRPWSVSYSMIPISDKTLIRMKNCLPVEIDIPVMLGWKRTHCLKKGFLRIIALFCRRPTVTGLFATREPSSKERWAKRHYEAYDLSCRRS